MQAFKAYATRRLRETHAIQEGARVWERHGSTRYLHTDESVWSAIDYVLNRQGAPLPKTSPPAPRPEPNPRPD